jgi:hypothetical protein
MPTRKTRKRTQKASFDALEARIANAVAALDQNLTSIEEAVAEFRRHQRMSMATECDFKSIQPQHRIARSRRRE